jgi:hypothetical protein
VILTLQISSACKLYEDAPSKFVSHLASKDDKRQLIVVSLCNTVIVRATKVVDGTSMVNYNGAGQYTIGLGAAERQ